MLLFALQNSPQNVTFSSFYFYNRLSCLYKWAGAFIFRIQLDILLQFPYANFLNTNRISEANNKHIFDWF